MSLARGKRVFIHEEDYDLMFTTIDHLQELQNSYNDVDHWEYLNCEIIFDKTSGLEELISRISKYDEKSRVNRLQRYYLEYWENTLASIKCYKHKNLWGNKIHAALAMNALISLIFNINHKWAPKIQWVLKEISFLQNKPEEFEAKIEKILSESNPELQRELWKEVTDYLNKEDYSWVNNPDELIQNKKLLID
jgi:hypothetical protein